MFFLNADNPGKQDYEEQLTEAEEGIMKANKVRKKDAQRDPVQQRLQMHSL